MQVNYDLIVALLVIVGALNWGLVAGMDFDLVSFLTSWESPELKQSMYSPERLAKILVGLAGVAAGYKLLK